MLSFAVKYKERGRGAREAIRQANRAALEAAAEGLEKAGDAEAPEDTGALKASRRVRFEKRRAIVTWRAPYALATLARNNWLRAALRKRGRTIRKRALRVWLRKLRGGLR